MRIITNAINYCYNTYFKLQVQDMGKAHNRGMNLFGAKILLLSKKHLRYSLKGEEDDLAERKGEAEEPYTCTDEAKKETKKTLTILF